MCEEKEEEYKDEIKLTIDQQDKIKIPLDPQLEHNPPRLPQSHKDIIDPLDGITSDDERECCKKAIEKLKKTHDKELSLMKSEIKVPHQEYMVASFVGPQCRQKTESCGIKVWGVFETIEQSQKWAKYINSTVENQDFDVYVLEMYTWCLIPPDPKAIENQEYHDNRLNSLIRQHKAQQYKVKEVFDLRTEKLKNQKPKEPKEELKEELNEESLNQKQRDLVLPSSKLPEFKIEQVTDDEVPHSMFNQDDQSFYEQYPREVPKEK
jgi:hypothetical protein